MSKIGKKNIIIPKDSSIKVEGGSLTISGPKGTKKLTVNDKIFSSKVSESEFQILPLEKKLTKETSIMWGTYRSLINNAVTGVTKGHEKILELSGVGLKFYQLDFEIVFCYYKVHSFDSHVFQFFTLKKRRFLLTRVYGHLSYGQPGLFERVLDIGCHFSRLGTNLHDLAICELLNDF